MKTSKSTYGILTANQAVANIAYKTNEVFPIYPITPASDMGELVEQWYSEHIPNSFGNIPSVFQMQSESGVAGAMHGAIQTGSLSSTFTASQGLLLMLPNMYKIAGELTPNVIHVATRSVATHALSVFGDHSDIMAVRQSGYAMLGSASVQEAHDFALISQAATLESSIPFVHFFDGFRTSHEINKIETIKDGIIHSLINQNDIKKHRARALNPNHPVLRGTAQGSDVFFQSREAVNTYYEQCPNIVQKHMNQFATLTGRHYHLFDYVGHPKAEHLIVSMASSTETIETTINALNNEGEKYGLIKVRLFRPFSTKHLIEALPSTVQTIAVLDRTKEPGATGEPLYLDILKSISEAFQNKKINTHPIIVGGRYGLSSKEFTPSMVNAIYQNLKQDAPKNNFTIGIHDDVKNLSLDFSAFTDLKNAHYQAIFYQDKNKSTSDSFSNVLERVGAKSNTFIQGYIECDYKKSNTYNTAHLRINATPIKAPYLIQQADFIGCQNVNFSQFDNALQNLRVHGTLLINTSQTTKAFWQSLPENQQGLIIDKHIKLFIVSIEALKASLIIKEQGISAFHACFLALKSEIYINESMADLKDFIYRVNTSHTKQKEVMISTNKAPLKSRLLGQLLENNGNKIPVSVLPTDGTYPTNTSQYNPIQNGEYLPEWHTDLCTQCGVCSMVCPQAALRIKAYDSTYLNESPRSFKHVISEDFDLLHYTIQINPEQCNSCNHCIDACSTKALSRTHKNPLINTEKENWKHFESIPEFDRTLIDTAKISEQQLQEPLFKYSSGVEGCGEASYLKLMSQLFGDKLLIANATGASSIFGGALPTTPWAKNKKGQGPAWSNSLFEDNAEFGLGFRMSLNQQEKQARFLLEKLKSKLNTDLVEAILNAKQTTEIEINLHRENVALLNEQLQKLDSQEAKQLLNLLDSLTKTSVWVVGGDGWAYDIGYGGLDHVIASGENVNILVLDNEVYDNTGAQASKATPFGAEAKFACNGKQKQKKDLGLLAMTYDDVYVASVAIGANQEQTLKAFNDAESFDGPSIIIAYCHSDSHGIDMKQPSKYHKAAVASGQWLLYRRDPRRKQKRLNPLQLDSNAPSIKIQDYLKLEKRFSKLCNQNIENFSVYIQKKQKQIDKRFNKYLAISLLQITPRAKLLQNKKMREQLKQH